MDETSGISIYPVGVLAAWNEGYKAGEANENHFYWHAEGTES